MRDGYIYYNTEKDHELERKMTPVKDKSGNGKQKTRSEKGK
jgi:hypothetical protein